MMSGNNKGGGSNNNKSGGSNNNNRNNNKGSNKNAVYDEYLSIEEVEEKLSQNLLQGNLKVIATKRKNAYVTCPGISIDIFINTEIQRNRAIHGDVVIVELLPESEWLPITKIMNTENDKSEEVTLKDVNINTSSLKQVQEALWQPRHDLVQKFEKGLKSSDDAEKKKSSVVHHVEKKYKELNKQPCGRVVYIMDSCHQKTQIGSLQANCELKPGQKLPESEAYVMFSPSDPRYPNALVLRIELPMAYVENPYTQKQQIWLLDISSDWPTTSKMAYGINVRSIGEAGSIEAETQALLLQNNINSNLFTSDQIACLQGVLGGVDISSTTGRDLNWQIPAEEISKRRDLRSHRIFTIDPPTAKDLDDALHITELKDGTYEIGVHIADVSYFLEEGTLLDEEAKKRATSTYLVQRVIPMLPPILCEQLCSLNPNVDRLAFSCIWIMNKDGSLSEKPVWYGRSVIRSCAKLDYPTAQRMIDGIIPSTSNDDFLKDVPEDVWESARRPVGHTAWQCVKDVCMMNSIARERRSKRVENGALVLTRSKIIFRLNQQGNPETTGTYTIRQSNQLVEEYMLLANYLVAQALIEMNGGTAFLRNHGPPDVNNLNELKELGLKLNLHIDTESAHSLQESLKTVMQTCDPVVATAITALISHPMKLANYVVAGTIDSGAWRHYALAIPYYTHFTSPIRRYADVSVHRLLDLALRSPQVAAEQGKDSNEITRLQKVADNCNTMRVAAKTAQERSDRVFLSVYISQHPMDTDAVVIGIGEKSFTVLILELGIEMRLFVDQMDDVTASFDKGAQKITLVYQNSSAKKSNKKTPEYDKLVIGLMSPVVVHVSAKETPPIDIRVTVLRAGNNAVPADVLPSFMDK